jgi:hypothetical protein
MFRIEEQAKQETSMMQSALLDVCSMFVSCLDYSSNLKKEAIYSFKTSVSFQLTTWHYIREEELFKVTTVTASNPVLKKQFEGDH